MREPPVFADEKQRVRALRDLDVLDRDIEPVFDDIVRLAAAAAGTPMALFTLIDVDRQLFKARCGLDMIELPRALSICGHAIASDAPFIVPDTLQDLRFRDNPLVSKEPKLRFYGGVPVRERRGHRVGTLCVLDQRPRVLSDSQVRMLVALARQVEVQLEVHRSLRALESVTQEGGAVRDFSQPAIAGGDSIPFRIRLEPSLSVEYLGGAFTALTGYEPEPFYADPRLGEEIIHPEDAPILRQLFAMPALFVEPVILRWRTSDERWIWLEHRTWIAYEDGKPAVLEGVAIPPRPEDEGQRDRASELSEALREHAIDMVMVLDRDGTVRYQSPSVARVLGYREDELVGDNLLDFVHPDDRVALGAALRDAHLCATFDTRARYRFLHRSGHWRDLESIGKNLLADPAVRGVLLQSRDMTTWATAERALVEAEESSRRLALSRRRLLGELHRVYRFSRRLASLAVHDVKSPLTAIILNAHVLLEQPSMTAEDTGALRGIVASASSVQRMIMNLIDISHYEHGQLPLARSELDLASLIDAVCEREVIALRARDQRIERDVHLDDPRIFGDRGLLERALHSLIENSCQYAPVGSAIGLCAVERHRHIDIAISDKGPRVPEELKATLFTVDAGMLRSRGDHPRASRGLGLAFSRLATEAHGGRLWIEDVAEGGSRFRIELPRSPVVKRLAG